MRIRWFMMPVLVVVVACGMGCTSEQFAVSLGVTATPNPVTGAADPQGRLWEYRITIVNFSPVGVFVDYYHVEMTGTDTGADQPLQKVENSPVIGEYIAAGASLEYAANRNSQGKFSRGTEHRIYHTRGQDGKYYSGEVLIALE